MPVLRKKLLQQAKAAYENRRFAEAETMCREMLADRPRDVDALVLLATMAFDKGQYDSATSHLSTAVQVQPRSAELWLMLAWTLHKGGRLDEANDAYDRVLRVQRRNVSALTGKAAIAEQRGQIDEAVSIIEPLISSEKADAETGIVHARILMQRGDLDAAVTAGQRFDVDATPPPQRRTLLFIIGQSLEKLARYDEAFDAYQRANAMLKVPFNATAATARYQRVMEVFSREQIAGMPKATHGSELPIFIVGMPRSGTTLVEHIIDAHPRAHGGGELNFMSLIAERLPMEISSDQPWPDCARDLDQGDVDRLGRQYIDEVSALAPDAVRVTDKQLGNHQSLGLAALLVPQARFIYCVRDALDTCFSCYAQPLPPTLHPYASDFQLLGTIYRLIERMMELWLDATDLRAITVRYEDLIAEQETESRRIIDFLGLDWSDDCLRYHSKARTAHTLSYDQVRRPIYTSSIGRAKRFGEHLRPLIESLGS